MEIYLLHESVTFPRSSSRSPAWQFSYLRWSKQQQCCNQEKQKSLLHAAQRQARPCITPRRWQSTKQPRPARTRTFSSLCEPQAIQEAAAALEQGKSQQRGGMVMHSFFLKFFNPIPYPMVQIGRIAVNSRVIETRYVSSKRESLRRDLRIHGLQSPIWPMIQKINFLSRLINLVQTYFFRDITYSDEQTWTS